MKSKNQDSKIGAAILGLFAALKICKREGYDIKELVELVEVHVKEWGLLEESEQQER